MVDRRASQVASTRVATTAVGMTLLCASAMYVGRLTHVPPSQLAMAWPAAGVAVVWFLCLRSWGEHVFAIVAIMAVTGVVNQTTGVEPVGAWLFGMVNAANGIVGAAVLRASGWTTPRPVRSLRDVAVLAVASVAGGLVSALSGGIVAAVRFGSGLSDGVGLIGFRNALSAFVGVSTLLAIGHLVRRVRRLSLTTVALSAFALTVTTALVEVPWPIAFIILPPLFLVALRCGTVVTAAVVGLQGIIVVTVTASGRGPLATVEPVELRVILAQLLILVLALVGLVASIIEQDRADALAASRRDRDRLRDHMDAALVAGAHLVLGREHALRTVEVNSALAGLVALDHTRLVGTDPTDWFTADSADVLRQGIEDLAAGDSVGWRSQLQMSEAYGGAWVDAAMSLVGGQYDGDGDILAEVNLQMIDITVQREAEHELARQALHDDLTGLPNRTLWTDRLRQALRQAARSGRPVAVLYVDVDHFKVINDTYGHQVGDGVLKAVARKLSELVRAEDTVARIGGDEFVVLCPDLGEREQAEHLAERIQLALRSAVDVGGHGILVSTSVGVAISSADDVEGHLLMRRADTALYAAKERGRARFEVYHPDLHARAESIARTLVDLDRAHRVDELDVHYQPIIDLDTGDVVALEALLRWHHPERGLLAAAEFIDVLEDSDLVHCVGRDVLNRACRDGAGLVASGHPVKMHVNISARELSRPGLPEAVQAALDESGLPAHLLVLEITETRLMAVTGSLLRDLTTLRDLGVQLGADDFGTGFSALIHLVELPVSFVKLDRSFVGQLVSSHSARSVTSGVRAMTEGLGLDVIAEGVETAEQEQLLRDAGYRLMQGYRYGRPASLDMCPRAPAVVQIP